MKEFKITMQVNVGRYNSYAISKINKKYYTKIIRIVKWNDNYYD